MQSDTQGDGLRAKSNGCSDRGCEWHRRLLAHTTGSVTCRRADTLVIQIVDTADSTRDWYFALALTDRAAAPRGYHALTL